jgi:hypothetical protein
MPRCQVEKLHGLYECTRGGLFSSGTIYRESIHARAACPSLGVKRTCGALPDANAKSARRATSSSPSPSPSVRQGLGVGTATHAAGGLPQGGPTSSGSRGLGRWPRSKDADGVVRGSAGALLNISPPPPSWMAAQVPC